MNIPNFTADASLYETVAGYRSARTFAGRAGGISVVPQLRRSIGFCMADCDYTTSDPLSNAACKFDCMDQGGDDGPSGPPTQTCRPSCGPCIGGIRTCITRDCDTYERSCRTVGGRTLG